MALVPVLIGLLLAASNLEATDALVDRSAHTSAPCCDQASCLVCQTQQTPDDPPLPADSGDHPDELFELNEVSEVEDSGSGAGFDVSPLTASRVIPIADPRYSGESAHILACNGLARGASRSRILRC